MATRAVVAALVANTGPAYRLAPAQPSTFSSAVLMAVVAVPTDAHLLRTAPATVQPIALLARPHAPGTPHWTTPRRAWHKGNANAPSCAPARRRPGVSLQECARAFAYSASASRIAQRPPSLLQQESRSRAVAPLHFTGRRRSTTPTASVNLTRSRSNSLRVRNAWRTILGTRRVNPQNPAELRRR